MSYAKQVRQYRALAEVAIRLYPFRVRKLDFINHGENSTFKVTAVNGARYLLRIHRDDYHSDAALQEELDWMESLSRAGLRVSSPVLSRRRRSVEVASSPVLGERRVSVLHWVDGRFLSKSISESDMYKIGELLGRIQKTSLKFKVKHRKYWTSAGLVGDKPKFGSIDKLSQVKVSEQKIITAARRKVLKRLRAYEGRFPARMGMVHADLHFGNLLKIKGGEIAAIDFDDCGFSFRIMDLVPPLYGLSYHLSQAKRHREYKKLKAALIAGYSSVMPVALQDLVLLQDLLLARRLTMLGWLNARSDNPRLKKYFKKALRAALKYIARPHL